MNKRDRLELIRQLQARRELAPPSGLDPVDPLFDGYGGSLAADDPNAIPPAKRGRPRKRT